MCHAFFKIFNFCFSIKSISFNFILSRRRTFNLLIAFIIIFNISAQAPPFRWAKNYSGIGEEYSDFITGDEAGNTYSVGTFTDRIDMNPAANDSLMLESIGRRDVYIVKTDKKGKTIWAHSFGDKNEQNHDKQKTIYKDHKIHICWTIFDTTILNFGNGKRTIIPEGKSDICIMTIDLEGNILELKQLFTENAYLNDYQIDKNNNFILSGSFSGLMEFKIDENISSTLFSNLSSDIFILKLDKDFNLKWLKSYGGRSNEYRNKVTCDANGNSYLCFSFEDSISVIVNNLNRTFKTDAYEEMIVIKLDPDGKTLWAFQTAPKSYGYTENSIVSTSDDKIIISGKFDGPYDFNPDEDQTYLLNSIGKQSPFFLAVDHNAQFLWAKSIGNSNMIYVNTLRCDSKGNMYATGYFTGTTDFDPDSSSASIEESLSSNAFILKLDNNGKFEWVYNSSSNTSNVYGMDTYVTPFDEIITAGYYFNPTAFDPDKPDSTLNFAGKFDVFILKLSHFNVGFSQTSPTPISIKTFPNPANTTLTVDSELDYADLSIYDMNGKSVKSLKNINTSEVIDISELPSGLYILEIHSSTNNLKTIFIKD